MRLKVSFAIFNLNRWCTITWCNNSNYYNRSQTFLINEHLFPNNIYNTIEVNCIRCCILLDDYIETTLSKFEDGPFVLGHLISIICISSWPLRLMAFANVPTISPLFPSSFLESLSSVLPYSHCRFFRLDQ